jgi:beta-galactosidase
VLGEFVWTGFDYLGEPTPFFDSEKGPEATPEDWPARSSYFGMIDLAGFPKDRYYLHQSQWTSKPMVHLLPHWNWPGREGQTIPVIAYSNADEVELFLNGKPLGKKARFADSWEIPVSRDVLPGGKLITKYRRVWQVPYAPGTLRAVAYNQREKVAEDIVITAGPPARLRLLPDRSDLEGLDDLSFITVRVEDKDGNLCPMADTLIHFDVGRAGEIAGVDNGNAATDEPFHADHRRAFSGLALLIVRPRSKEGKIHVRATADGLSSADADLSVR